MRQALKTNLVTFVFIPQNSFGDTFVATMIGLDDNISVIILHSSSINLSHADRKVGCKLYNNEV